MRGFALNAERALSKSNASRTSDTAPSHRFGACRTHPARNSPDARIRRSIQRRRTPSPVAPSNSLTFIFPFYMFPFRLAMMKHTSNHPDHSSAPPNLEKLENYPDLFARKTIELNGKRSRKMLWILLEM